MARKDVDLVIRARDEAAKVVDKITASLNEFVSAQASLDSRAKRTESSLSQLGSALAALDKAVGTLDIGARLSDDLGRAASAIDRLEQQAAGTQGELRNLSRELERQTAISGRYEQKLNGAAAALEKQRAAVSRAKTEQAELTRATQQAEAAQAKAAARQARLPEIIARQSEAVARATQRYAELAREIEATAKPGKTLQANLEAASKAVTRQEAALAELRAELASVNSAQRAAGAAAAIFAGQAERAAANLARQERALTKISENYTELGVKGRAASQQQAAVESSVARVTTALARQNAQIEQAEDDFVQLAQAAGQADRALEELSRQSLGNLKGELDLQRRAMLEAKREYVGLTQAATALAGEIRTSEAPTQEMAQRFELLKARAAAAKAEYLEQRQALELLGRAYRAAGTDLSSLQAAQARFAQVQQQSGAAIAASRGSLAQQTTQINRLIEQTRRATAENERLNGSFRAGSGALSSAASSTSTLSQAYRQLYGDSRQALSFTQRLRGEVLALIAAYGGLFGVIDLLNRTVQAYQTLEAAQARLNVANEGDIAQSAQDLDFLRRSANRLGVDLGTLANEYSKFAIATQGTNLEGQATRRIFLAVSEAARVNRASQEQLAGTFVALTQIVSKGSVSMEELRQQLGDRLPGAVQILADALDLPVAKLIELISQGQISSDALLPFAEELDRRFASQLPASLESTTVALGRLQNAAFQALLAFGEAGFIESFTDLANQLTETLQSADFATFSANVSAALSVLIDGLSFLAENFQLVVAAVGGFLGLKIAPFLIVLGARLGEVAGTARLVAAGAASATGPLATMGGAAAGAATRVGLLSAAIRTLLSATGVGLLIAGGAALFTFLQTEADTATEALVEHQRIVDQVRDAYDRVGGAANEWRQAVQGVTATEAVESLRRLREGLVAVRRDFNTAIFNDGSSNLQRILGLSAFTGVSRAYEDAIRAIIAQWDDGQINAEELRSKIDEVNRQFDDGSAASRRYANELIQIANQAVELEGAVEEASSVVQAFEGDTEAAGDALEDLSNTARRTGPTIEEELAAKTERFNAAMLELRGTIPQVKAELDRLADSEAIDTLMRTAIEAASSWGDVVTAITTAGEAQRALQNETVNSALSGSLVDRIIGVESAGNPTARNPRSSATGLGQFIESTWLNLFQKYFPDRARGMSEPAILALRNDPGISRTMVELYTRELATSLARANLPVTDANIYLSYFLGPADAQRVLRANPNTPVQGLIQQSSINANPTILGGGVTAGQVIQRVGGSVGNVTSEQLDLAEQVLDVERRQTEELVKQADEALRRSQEQRQRTQERIAENEFEIQQQGRLAAGQDRQAAIEEALREARRENPAITAEELALIERQTGALFDQERAISGAQTGRERAQAAEQEINNLLAQRSALEEQMDLARQAGDQSTEEQLRAKVAEVNAELTAAIQNARDLWAAVGGSEAEAALARLETARIQTERYGQGIEKVYLDWTRVADLLVGGLSNAFDQFAKAVAEGENPLVALRNAFLQFASDFLLQIAQMIIQQAVFNALQGAFGGTAFGARIGFGHTGGIVGSRRVGSGNGSRVVNPAIFAGAMRYHEGGIIGLRPGEVPIIAEKGEAMLTEDDPFHPNNRGKLSTGGGSTTNTRIINAIDGASFLAAALASEEGEQVILNWMRANSDAVSATRGG